MAALSKQIEAILQKHPFLTLAKYDDQEYLGIVQNQDGNIISMYVYDRIKDIELKTQFMELGAEWWWGTNRAIPINIILGERFKPFQSSLLTFNYKDFDIIAGPIVCLKDISKKRIKRKNIQLIRRVD